MSLKMRYTELRKSIGSFGDIRRKTSNAWQTLSNLLSRQERLRRLHLLKEAGQIDEIPTTWQIYLGAYDMMTGYIIPSNNQFYEHYDQNQYWLQFLRLLDEPSAMMDPTGLAVSEEMVISHILHVVHCSVGYDVALLHMFPGSIDELRRQLDQVVAGTHPRQEAIETVIERPDYPAALQKALNEYVEDPAANWRVDTFPAPEGCDELFDFGVERYGTLGRLLQHAVTLPVTPWESFKLRFASRWTPSLMGGK